MNEMQHKAWDIKEIMDKLPHRYPFLLIDRVEDCVPGEYARSKKCVSMNEPQFQGHFPAEPVMPGVLILEAMAQTGAVALLSMEEYRGRLVYFGGVSDCRFRKKVVPGDVLTIETKIIKRKGPVGIGRAQAFADGQVVAEATLSFVASAREG